MDVQISDQHLFSLLEKAAEMGAKQVLCSIGKLKPYLKKSEAFRAYGRKHVERWIAEGWITQRKDGDHSAAWRIDRIELEALRNAQELLRYL